MTNRRIFHTQSTVASTTSHVTFSCHMFVLVFTEFLIIIVVIIVLLVIFWNDHHHHRRSYFRNLCSSKPLHPLLHLLCSMWEEERQRGMCVRVCGSCMCMCSCMSTVSHVGWNFLHTRRTLTHWHKKVDHTPFFLYSPLTHSFVGWRRSFLRSCLPFFEDPTISCVPYSLLSGHSKKVPHWNSIVIVIVVVSVMVIVIVVMHSVPSHRS
mmetsp:Transcript_53904/g.60999  ORF Transcript_53904/g.60999 Transcript_53904/m.60999 type:complete len:209 (-) Transcript_53904:601-1227(-)